MSLRFHTADEQLDALQQAIRDIRTGRRSTADTAEILKSVAVDLRARRPGEPGHALRELQRRLADAAASRTALGWEQGALRGIAEQVIGHWPAIRQALERFDEELKSPQQNMTENITGVE